MDAIHDLQYYENLSPNKTEIVKQDNRLRRNALQEVAISLGARAGLAHRAKEINQDYTSRARSLDSIFDFRRLLINTSPNKQADGVFTILPPVIIEAKNITIANDDTLKIADRSYKVETQAKFVTNPPTWKEYLIMDFPAAEKPNAVLMPKDGPERELWKTWVNEGWVKGVAQADSINELNISRLQRDILGMIKYRVLLSMNMVSKPYVAEARYGVTGNRTEMTLDDRALRITAMPGLNTNYQEWNPIVTKDENK